MYKNTKPLYNIKNKDNNMKTQSVIIISEHGKKVYLRETIRGWAIIIIPDKIRVDNFHGFPHIHLTFDGEKIAIKYDDMNEIVMIIRNHLQKNKNLIKKELLEELLWLK